MLFMLQSVGFMVLALGVGFLSSGLGLGGGVLMVPAFAAFVSGMDIHTAKGTSLFIILLVALTSFPRVRLLQQARPPWRYMLLLTVGALAGGYFGASVTTRMSETTVLILYLIFIVVLLGLLLTQPALAPKREVKHRNALLAGTGALAGAVGSATGTGGGAVMTPVALSLNLLPHTQLVYVANQVMIATSLAAAPAHFFAEQSFHRFWTVGHVCLGLAPLMLLFAQVGVVFGARMNRVLRARHRRLLLSAVLCLVFLRMLLRLLANGG